MADNTAPDDVPLPVLQATFPHGSVGVQHTWSAIPGAEALVPFPPPAPGRQIVFTLTPEDLAASLPPAAPSPPQPVKLGGVKSLLLVAAMIPVILLARTLTGSSGFAAPSPAGPSNWLTGFLVPFLIPVLVIAAFYVFVQRSVRNQRAKQLDTLDAMLVRITPDYLYQLDPQNESKTRWIRVARLAEGKAHFFVVYLNNTYVPIPKRAFTSEAEAQSFLEEMNALWRAGGGGAPG